jgi:hypothetical protein
MATLPYLTLPKIMIIELMHFCVLWLNSFPVKSGVYVKWSPRELILRHWLDAKLHCKTPFGAYCKMHTDPDITNTIEPSTKLGICMGPTRNLQGSYKFMSFTTGKKIARHIFTEMPMTEAGMKQIKKWVMKDLPRMDLHSKIEMERNINLMTTKRTHRLHTLKMRIFLRKPPGY